MEHKSADAETQWNQLNFEDIELGKQIGGGGFAVVCKGRYRGNRVALKTMFDPRADKQLKQEYMDELQIVSRLKHPNIIKLVGACTTPPNLCMVMELCRTSLFSLLHQQQAALTEKEKMKVALETSEAFEYLHSQTPPIIHRDLKSQNVLLSNSGQVKLCDFGLVCTENTTAGTPTYMAPELLRNAPFSKKVDNYAFGILLWELVMGALPYAGWEINDIRNFVLRGDRLNLPRSGCHKACLQLIERCWSDDPTVRPEFAKIAKALSRIHAGVRDRPIVSDSTGGGDAFDALSSKMSHK